MIREGLDLIYSLNLRLPTRFVILDKAIATLGAVGVELYPDFNVFEVARPYARGLLAERFSPRRMSLRVQSEVRELAGVARELPYQMRDVMEQTRQGRLELQIRNPGFDDLTYHIDHAVNRIAVALIVLGGLVGSSIVGVLARDGPHVMGLHLALVHRLRALRHLRRLARVGDRPLGTVVADARLKPGVGLKPGVEAQARRRGGVSRPCVSSSASTGSWGRARTRRPSRPVVSTAAQSAFSDSLLGRVDGGGEEGVEVGVGHRRSVDASWRLLLPLGGRGREREEDLAAAVMRDRAGAGQAEARPPGEPLELGWPERRVGGDDAMQLPAGGRWSRPSPIVGNTGTPSMRRSRAEPKFASTSTPTVASASGTRRLEEPIPPFQPKRPCRFPRRRTPARRRRRRHRRPHRRRPPPRPAPCARRSASCRRIRRRPGSRRRRRRLPASASHATATAPSKMRPTAIVEVRNTGVSISPHSEIWRKPVSSPAPFSAAAPAGTGRRKADASPPGRIAVTPVRAIPRPCRWRRLVAHHGHVADSNAGDVGYRVERTRLQVPDPEAVLAQRRRRSRGRAYRGRVAAMATVDPARVVGRPPAA